MADRDTFIKYLTNVRNSGQSEVSVDVNFLLALLGEEPTTKPSKTVPSEVVADGGTFDE